MDSVNSVYLDTNQLRKAFANHVSDIEMVLGDRASTITNLEIQVIRLTASLKRARKRNRLLSMRPKKTLAKRKSRKARKR